MAKEDPIYITGHLHPDTDSVASAIAYAFFKRASGVKAIACRLGPLNSETKYLLDRFHFEEPYLLKDARKTLGEIDLDSPEAVGPETTINETISLMQKTGRPSFAVVDESGKMMGMVTKSDLTSVGLGDTASGIALLKITPVSYIARTISGKIIYDDPEKHVNGKVSIIALTKSKLANYEIRDRIVIVGDDPRAQEELIRKGAGILIVVWAKEIDQRVIDTAKEYHCPVIISGHGSMNTSRYIYFAPPVKLVMKTKLITFRENMLAEDAQRKMMTSRYRSYPVVDDEGRLIGYVGRYHIINYKNKKVILVDHNEFSQSVRGLDKAQLLEVVDHHRINDFATSQPVSFRAEIVGSTATIIASMLRENQIPIPQNLAGLLLGAILSDTLMFQSPTTTDKDRTNASILAALADLDIDTFGKELFSVNSVDADGDITEMISQDIKYYDIRTCRTMISQVIVKTLEDVRNRQQEIQDQLDAYAEKKDIDLLVVAFSCIMENGSIFFEAGEHADWAQEAFPDRQGETHSLQKGVLSRKAQILPMLTEVVSKYA